MGALELQPSDVKFHRILKVHHCAVGGFDRQSAGYMGPGNALLRLFLQNPSLKSIPKGLLKVHIIDAKHGPLLAAF